MTALLEIAGALRAEGGLLAEAVVPDGDLARAGSPLADRVERAPRAAGRPGELGFVLEAVHEGWRLHHGGAAAPARLVRTDDEDLALLAGDRLYALGLARLAETGDLGSVRELADVISLCAQAAAEDAPDLAEAAWGAGLAAVGWGPATGQDQTLEEAKEAARDGAADAALRLRAAARRLAGDLAL
jgi:hypothetical protein